MLDFSSGRYQRPMALTFLVALVAVVATTLSSVSASAATTSVDETRVGAHAVVLDKIAGPPKGIRAGRRLGEGRSGVVTAVATSAAANAASRANAPVNMVGTYALKPLQLQDAVARWDEFLGSGAHPNIHPRTGLSDADRLVSSDGLRSIRFGNHEMGSSPTKFHFHEETWSFDDVAGVWNLQNIVVRVPFPKGAW